MNTLNSDLTPERSLTFNGHLSYATSLFLALWAKLPGKAICPKRPPVLHGHWFPLYKVTDESRFDCIRLCFSHTHTATLPLVCLLRDDRYPTAEWSVLVILDQTRRPCWPVSCGVGQCHKGSIYYGSGRRRDQYSLCFYCFQNEEAEEACSARGER